MMSEGFLLAMLDERLSCDVNPSLELTTQWLAGQRVIALCGASGLSDENAQRLATWVREGGALLATYDSGLYDAHGQVRQDGGVLKEVLGVEMRGEPLGGQADAFYRLKRTHPALAPYKEGAVVMGDPRLVSVEVREGATLLADYWNWDRGESRGPAIVLNNYGKGRSIYVAGSLEANYASSRVLSLQRMLGSMVRYLAGEAPAPFRLAAPKGVYGILRRAPSGDLTLWVLANVGFKDAAVGRMRQEFVPVSNLLASILVPEGRKVKSVELMRSGQTVPFTVEGGYAEFTLPVVHIAEAVHLALA
jgi:Beta-galactosidase trimerisation domain